MKKDPYRYRELISELNELVSNGDLLPVDEIQILRDISGYRDGYQLCDPVRAGNQGRIGRSDTV